MANSEESWTLEQAAGQVLVAGFEGDKLPQSLANLASRGELGGLILFRRNLGEPSATLQLLAACAAAFGPDRPPLLAVDQEGGRVARLGPPVVPLPPARVFGTIDDVALTRRAGRVLGQQLAALGFTCDFAPVLDVDSNPNNPIIGDRSFSSDPERVAAHGSAFAAGLEAGGVLACGKHFPGHGDTDLDSHLALPRVRRPASELSEVELRPFQDTASSIPLMMTAHVVYDALDPHIPATLSRTIIEKQLRQGLGYQGLVVTDDLEMEAVQADHPPSELAERAIDAGCDVLLFCSDPPRVEVARQGLVARAKRDEAFAARLQRAAARFVRVRRRVPPRPLPLAQLEGLFQNEEAQRLAQELADRQPRAPR